MCTPSSIIEWKGRKKRLHDSKYEAFYEISGLVYLLQEYEYSIK